MLNYINGLGGMNILVQPRKKGVQDSFNFHQTSMTAKIPRESHENRA